MAFKAFLLHSSQDVMLFKTMGRTSRIRTRRKCSTTNKNVSESTYIVNLIQWMREHGWRAVCPLRLTEFPTTGRGLMAKRKIEKGDTLVRIPASLLITTATVCNSLGGETLRQISMQQQDVGFSSQQLLAYFLVWERHLADLSSWQKYITTLPSSFSSPLFLKEEHVNALPGFVKDIVIASKRLVNESWLHLVSLFATSKCEHCNQSVSDLVSWESFLWGWCCVNTRAVYIEPKLVPSHKLPVNDIDCLALAPYLDLINHSDLAQVNASLNTAGSFYEIRTLRPIKRFKEVFINYGPHSNIKLYTEYGFVLTPNKHDIVPLEITNLEAAFTTLGICLLNLCEKKSFFQQYGLLSNMFISRCGLSWNAIVIVRILQCDVRSFQIWKTIAFSDEQSAYSCCNFRNLVSTLYSNTKEGLLNSLQNLKNYKINHDEIEKNVDMQCLRVSQTLLSELMSVVESALAIVMRMTDS